MEPARSRGDDDRAVSEVISVVLMVAVTIVLAAMIGTVLLNFVTDVDTNPIAGANVDFDQQNDNISVLFTVEQKPDTHLEVTVYNSSGTAIDTKNVSEVGDRVTFRSENYSEIVDGERYQVIVVAVQNEQRAVIVDTTELL